MTWALRVPVGGNQKVVLLGLANHANPDGSDSYPSLDTLAVYGCCDRSTARRNVRRLADEGWIEPDGTGPCGQHRYRLRLEVPLPADGLTLEGIVPQPWRTCVYCGAAADVLDHVVPRSRGGHDGPLNRVPACRSCSDSKGALTLEEWAEKIGRDAGGLEAAVTGWQNTTLRAGTREGGGTDATVAPAPPVASAPRGGGTSATRGVAPVPPEPSIEPSRNRPADSRNARAHESNPDAFPDDLPTELHDAALEAGQILKRTALQRGQKRPVTRAAVGHAVLTFPDRDHVKVARDVEFWLLHGKGARKPCNDIVARYRHFLETSDPAAGPPLPAGVTPIFGGGGGQRMSNVDRVDWQIRMLRGEAG